MRSCHKRSGSTGRARCYSIGTYHRGVWWSIREGRWLVPDYEEFRLGGLSSHCMAYERARAERAAWRLHRMLPDGAEIEVDNRRAGWTFRVDGRRRRRDFAGCLEG